MTTTFQDHARSRPRWAKALIAAVTSAAVLAGALVAASPAAAAGSTPIFRLDDDEGATTANYIHFLSAIRANVDNPTSSNTVEGTNDLIDHTNPEARGYTEAVIVTEDGHNVRMRFRTNDLYLVGWFDNAGIYHYAGPAEQARIETEDRPRAQQLTGGADYGSLERLGQVDRTTMRFGRVQTEAHALSLWKSSSTQAMAAAVVYFAQFIAEAARFRGIQDTIAQDGFAGNPADSYARFTTIDHHLVQQETDWDQLSTRLSSVESDGSDHAPIPLTGWFRTGFGQVVELPLNFARDYARIMLLAHGYPGYVKRRQLTDHDTLVVAADHSGEFDTVQAAVDAVPTDGIHYTILIKPGTYHEVVVVPASKSNLLIKGDSTDAADVVITAERAHGMTNPATGQPYGTQGSAVLTVKAPGVTVAGITIQNTFDPAKHPEVGPYDTQAVAVAAMGDRQVFTQDRIISRQDTVLVKAPVATGQYRQYFVGSYIEGSVDFIFGNATAVFDRSKIAMRNWVGGTVLAPNTDKSRKYGILITGSEIFTNGVPDNTMYLGRPWHNTADASPQALVRNTKIHTGVTTGHPWTDMVPDYSWTQARFKGYNNTSVHCSSGLCASVADHGGANSPQMTDSEAADYTAQKYLAGTDGWNPVF